MNVTVPTILGKRAFNKGDQSWFAHISGDINQIHLDELAARRTMVADVVVHGVHLFLWCLNIIGESAYCPDGLSSVDIRFPKPTYLDEVVSLTLHKCSSEKLN